MKKTMMTTMMFLAMTSVVAAAETTTTPTSGMVNCGEKMKALIPLPTKFEELMTSVSDNMNAHATAMNASTDKNAKAEAHVFKKLADDHRVVAHQMKKIIKDMEAAGKLAPAPHDMMKSDPKHGEAMLNQAKLEREMAALMVKDAEETEKMVEAMKNPSAKK
jgi:NDP-sugar pyrophosphorylase family protein